MLSHYATYNNGFSLLKKRALLKICSLACIALPCFAFASEKISVYGFKAVGIPTSISIAIQENIEAELVTLKTYDVFSRSNLEDILRENAFQQTGSCDENSCLVKVGQIAGISKMFTGSISKIGYTYNIVFRIIDIATGKIEKSSAFKYDGNESGLIEFSSTSVKSFTNNEQPTNSFVKQTPSRAVFQQEKSPVEIKLERMQQNNAKIEKENNLNMTIGLIVVGTAVGVGLILLFASLANN